MADTRREEKFKSWLMDLRRFSPACHNLWSFMCLKGTRLGSGTLPSGVRVYAFWWIGPKEPLRRAKRRFEVLVVGRDKALIEIPEELLKLDTEEPVPLLIGYGPMQKSVRSKLPYPPKSAGQPIIYQGLRKMGVKGEIFRYVNLSWVRIDDPEWVEVRNEFMNFASRELQPLFDNQNVVKWLK